MNIYQPTRKLRLASIILALTSIVGGCAGVGGSVFIRATDDTLRLGGTTENEIRQRMGSPYQESVTTSDGKQVKLIIYTYANTAGEALSTEIIPARAQGFSFFEGKLVGYYFTSSWKEDHTNFDETKVSNIKKGITTRNEVEQLLGRPGGKFIYPITMNNDEEGFWYIYCQSKRFASNIKTNEKSLKVLFNREGIVRDVVYSESGEK